MAFIKQSTKHIDTYMVLEDPRPGSTAIYIQGDAHDHATLSPIFAKYLVLRSDGQAGSAQFGSHYTTTSISNAATHMSTSQLILTKGSTSVIQGTNTGNDPRTNIDVSWLLSMAPEYIPTGCSYVTDGVTSGILLYDRRVSGDNVLALIDTNINKELYDQSLKFLSFVDSSLPENSFVTYGILPYLDNTSKRIIRTNARGDANTNTGTGLQNVGITNNFRLGYLGTWPSTFTATLNATNLVNYTGQFLGPAVNGNVLFFLINSTDDINQKVLTYNMSTNTATYLHEFSEARTAFGGSVGGSRSTATGIRTPNKLASTYFTDPVLSNTRGFYVPYFDTANNYQPYYVRWNTLTDTFTRESNVHVYSNVSQTGYSMSSEYLNDLTGDPGDYGGCSSYVFNETFTHTLNGVTTRYLTLGALNGQYAIYDTGDVKRGFITYTVDPVDPTVLTYHSHFVARATPRNIVWLNDAKTLLGVFHYNTFDIYSFAPATGWVLTQTINERFWSVGRDRSDRIWAVAESTNSNYGDLHLITPQLPVTINIVPELETYNYQGSTINSYFTVEAINAAGSRVAANVTLVIDGSTLTFDDNSKSKIITTSTSGTVQANIKVTGSGFSQIVTSVTI